MAEVKITVKRFDRLKEFPEISGQHFGDAMETSVTKVLEDALPIAQTSFSPSGFYAAAFGSDTFVQASPLRIEGSVLNSAPHAAIIEGMDEQGNPTAYGRRPGAKFPNLTQLRVWVARAFGAKISATVMSAVKAERADKKKVSKKARIDRTEKEIDSVTFLIGRKIQREGIKARAPLQKSMKANQGFIQNAFDDAAVRVGKEVEGLG